MLAYTKSLRSNDVLSVRNEKLRRLVGAIPKEDLEEMRVATHEGCEQIEQPAYFGLTGQLFRIQMATRFTQRPSNNSSTRGGHLVPE